jgi:hypothetical protein
MLANGASQGTPSEVASDHSALVAELVERWSPALTPKSWDERLESLNEIHDYLVEEFATFAEFGEVFPLFIGALIEKLGNGPVTSRAQAHIYANSQSEKHRHAAGDWLKNNRG